MGPVFHIKRNADGSVDIDKARLVTKGFMQVHEVHYLDTSSPLAKLYSSLIPAYAECHDREVEMFTNPDIRQRFAVYLTSTILYVRISKISHLAEH